MKAYILEQEGQVPMGAGNSNFTKPTPSDSSNYVILEIKVKTLQRLITENRLQINELHCLNKITKQVICHALLTNIGKEELD